MNDELPLLQVLRADVEASTHPNYRLYNNAQFWLRVLAKVLISPGVQAVIMFRVSHVLAGRGLMPLAMVLRARALRRSGAEIHPSATIGPGLYLRHSSGVVIGAAVRIGRNCTLSQGITLGYSATGGAGDWGQPVLGDDVNVGANAVVVGSVTVGDGAVIGANAVVTRDVAPGAVVGGIPARELRRPATDDSAG